MSAPERPGPRDQDPQQDDQLRKVWESHGSQNWYADSAQNNSGGLPLNLLTKLAALLGGTKGSGGVGDSNYPDIGATNAENKRRYDEYLKMIQDLIGGSGYDFFGPKTTTQTGTSVSSPFFSAEAQPLVSKLSKLFQSRLDSPTGLPEGYLGAATRGINDSYEGARVAANNLAARRGLSAEQAVAIGTPIEAQRAGKIADVANQMPLLGRQLQNEDAQLAQAFAEMGKGTKTTSRGTTTGPADIGDYLAYLNMLQPYMDPILVPGAKTDNTGAYVGAGASVISALIDYYAGKK